MDKITLTENQKMWLTNLLENEAEEALGAASNEHLWALGSDTMESATQHEMHADENREYANLLRDIIKEYCE